MEIKSVSLHDLRKMNDSEGLVLQSCGGDLKEWIDGINDMLTESGILQNESQFEKVYSFNNGNLTCLLFPFDDVQLNVGRLAMWRLQTHAHGFPIMFLTGLAALFWKMNKHRMKLAALWKKPKI